MCFTVTGEIKSPYKLCLRAKWCQDSRRSTLSERAAMLRYKYIAFLLPVHTAIAFILEGNIIRPRVLSFVH